MLSLSFLFGAANAKVVAARRPHPPPPSGIDSEALGPSALSARRIAVFTFCGGDDVLWTRHTRRGRANLLIRADLRKRRKRTIGSCNDGAANHAAEVVIPKFLLPPPEQLGLEAGQRSKKFRASRLSLRKKS